MMQIRMATKYTKTGETEPNPCSSARGRDSLALERGRGRQADDLQYCLFIERLTLE
jgi:hypothetical protein